jgi:hypothetical protein
VPADGARGKATLAIVSVVATAAVGLAASATTFLVSRDDRATARANRIYERRATTYVEAIDMLERHLTVLANLDFAEANGPDGFRYEQVRVDDETDRAHVASRLIAFGSNDVLAAFARVRDLDRNAFAWVFGETPRETDVEGWRSKTDRAIEDLREGVTEFEKRLNRELTS